MDGEKQWVEFSERVWLGGDWVDGGVGELFINRCVQSEWMGVLL